ncbi:MAG TPA: BamA/TamA family outer membrane protein, partial [Elusimicrobiales bacterium]|nr:BamA/TamA family outer membrane protein [Elusimicrobiales bacterium]
PNLLGSGIRLSWEPKLWVTGKPSFYGVGIGARRSSKANYSLHMTGEELIADLPIFGHFYFNLTHSFFVKKISEGPVEDTAQVSERFPDLYRDATTPRDFHSNRFSLVYDRTDHLYLPRVGTYASASALYSNRKLGSDYEYRTYAFQVKSYYNYKEEGRFITAVHGLLQFQRGAELPFYAMPQLGEGTGLRMAGDGRFTDRGKMVLTVEERITLSRTPFFRFISETEIAPFLDIGTVFPKPSDFSAGKLKYGPGISARLVIRPQLVATMDFASGSEGSNAIIKVGYPF